MRRIVLSTPPILVALLLGFASILLSHSAPAMAQDAITTGFSVFMPLGLSEPPGIPLAPPEPTATPTPEPTVTPAPTDPAGLEWDPRLDQRFAVLVRASVAPGQGYWRLVKGVWYDVNDIKPMGVGDHDIAVDGRGASGSRVVNLPVKVTWDGASSEMYTEAKPGEEYAKTFPMYHVAPTYRVQIDDGAPSDAVDGLGMGSIQQPNYKIHTSYGFVWRWTVASAAAELAAPAGPDLVSPGWFDFPAPAADGTLLPAVTETPVPTAAETATPTPAQTVVATAEPTIFAPDAPLAGPAWSTPAGDATLP